jgi:hypothetical protein
LEPVRTGYFEATNGNRRFVVKKFRKSIFEPMRYEVIPGRLLRTPIELRIDGISIHKELERALAPFKLSSKKIRYFVKHLEEVVSHLDPRDLNRLPFESHNPSLWYFSLHNGIWQRALRSSKFLNKRDATHLEAFFGQNLEDGLFVATARVEFEVESRGEAKKSSSDTSTTR